MTKLEKVIQMKKEYKKTVKEVGREGIVEFLKTFFEANPDVQDIRWAQYTPYFNDGDACTFGLRGVDFHPIEASNCVFKYERDSSGFAEYYSLDDQKSALLCQNLKDLECQLEEVEDILEECFGDGVQVTVSRNGSVTINDYEHD